MTDPILTTKLYIPPPRPEIVSRTRLLEPLNKGLDHKLTLISAPAGFGKTTLASEWVSSNHFAVAWLSLDVNDNDPTRFLTYFIHALQQLDELDDSFGNDILALLETAQAPQIDSMMIPLLNKSLDSIKKKTLFVLDDFHLIENDAVCEAVNFWIDNMPAAMQLVIVTREDPQIPLSRLRVRDLLTELRAADLRFSPAEAEEFLNRIMGLSLTKEVIDELDTRTEGWIAGLQLAALSMQGIEDTASFIKSFTGSHRYILDYLIEEVLRKQSDRIKTFLLKTSILEQMSASLCDWITGMEDSHEILLDLERANLFIVPLDNRSGYYRYHHLFGDLLRLRVKQEYRDELAGLYRRAADWYEQKGRYVDAIEYYLEAGDFECAAKTILLGRQIIFDQNKTDQSHNYRLILRWLDRIPDQTLQNYPYLHLMYTYAAWELGMRDIAMLESHFQAAEIAYAALTADGTITEDDLDYRSIPFFIDVDRSRAIIYSGDFERAIEYAEKGLAIDLSDQPAMLVEGYIVLHWACREAGDLARALKAAEGILSVAQPAGYHFGIMAGNCLIGFAYHLQGQLTKAIQSYSTVIEYAQPRDLLWMRPVAISHIRWSNICYLRNELAQSESHLQKAIALSEKYGYKVNSTYARLYLAQLMMFQGEKESALSIIEEVEEAIRDDQNVAFNIEVNAYKAQIHARLGNREVATAWLQSVDLNLGKKIGYWRGVEVVQAAWVMLALNQIDEALALLPRLERVAIASGSLPNQIHALVMMAIARERNGDSDRALEDLDKAIKLAAPERFLQPFLFEGSMILSLCRKLNPEDELSREFIRILSDAILLPKSSPPSQPLIEPLSSRELDVLALMADGLTNLQIAEQLFLTVNTVKVHSRNIYQKLATNNRTQAAAKARELGLLQS